jgi:hypothetical protein
MLSDNFCSLIPRTVVHDNHFGIPVLLADKSQHSIEG